MADIVVPLVLEPIRDLLIYEAKFLVGVISRAEQLKTELARMQWFLKDAETKKVGRERIKEWVGEFREIAYDAEDVLESYASKMRQFRRRRRERSNNFMNYLFVRCATTPFKQLIESHKAGVRIEDLINKIKDLEDSFSKLGVRAAMEQGGIIQQLGIPSTNQQMLRRSYSHLVEEDFVGFGQDVETLVDCLVHVDQVRVVSIVGMGGCGKTATAQQVYNHQKIKDHFEIRAWAYVSQEWQAKRILLQILSKILPELGLGVPNVWVGEDVLVRELYKVQKNRKCLFVLDDVWHNEAWDTIKTAFRKESKIMVTTRNRPVALHIGPSGYHYELPLLDENQSFDLLQRKALLGQVQGKDIERLEELGRGMVEKCGGLPLAVAVLGGILAKKHSVEEWESVYEHVLEGERGWEDVLALSYNDLPYQLKRCLLYMATFPPGEYINERFLYHL